MKKVIIYTTNTCPYCVRAKSLLKKKDILYEEVNIEGNELLRDAMIAKGFLAGLPLGGYYEGMENDLLVAVTEIRTKAQIDAFAAAMKEVLV